VQSLLPNSNLRNPPHITPQQFDTQPTRWARVPMSRCCRRSTLLDRNHKLQGGVRRREAYDFHIFQPDLRPAASTSFSVICFWPFGKRSTTLSRLSGSSPVCRPATDPWRTRPRRRSIPCQPQPFRWSHFSFCARSSARKSASKVADQRNRGIRLDA